LYAEKDRLATSDPDRHEIEQLYAALRRGEAKLVGPSGEVRLLPDSLRSFLVELTGLLSEGKSVTIIRNQARFTTMEAASLLGVSRQFLVNLLEKGEIPYHLVGTHRRIYAQDLFQYQTRRDGQRHKIIRALAQAEAQEGLYGREPSSADEG
jgi:excisionase family DNA binding protein